MPEDKKPDANSWTVSTALHHLQELIREFRSHVDVRFNEADKRYEQRFVAQQEAMELARKAAAAATDKAEFNSDKWRQSANEWREAMNDRERKFLPRDEAMKDVRALEDKINDLKASRSNLEGKSYTANMFWGYLSAAAGIIVAGIGVMLMATG